MRRHGNSRQEYCEHHQRRDCCRPAHSCATFLECLEFFWQLRIAHTIPMKVYDRDAHTMLHFADAKVIQEWPPLFIFCEVFSDTFRKQNVPRVPAIHHPLRYVDPGTSYVRLSGHVDHTAHRTAVHP